MRNQGRFLGLGLSIPSSKLERAWAAGFFDGEGSFSIANRSQGQCAPQISVAQCNRGPLDRFRAAVFGIGKIYGPYKPKNQHSVKPEWRYKTGGCQASLTVVGALWPYLCEPQKSQCGVVMAEVVATRGPAGDRAREIRRRNASASQI